MSHAKSLTRTLYQYRYPIAVLLLGLLLLLIPTHTAASAGGPDTQQPQDLETQRLADTLARIQGVGRVHVLLSDHGAVVVCDGADLATVRLAITQAVTAYTGLRADRVFILQRAGSA